MIDTDGDNLSDFIEIKHFESNPLNADTDGDGLNDDVEDSLGTRLTDSDTDDDGLTDNEEGTVGTDPLIADTDGDGSSDGAEDLNANGIVDEGETDPLDPNSSPSKASLIAGTETLNVLYAGEISAAESNDDVCAVDGCVMTIFVTASQAAAAGINPFDIVWFHDSNEDQLIDVSPDSPEVLNGIPAPDTPTTTVTLVPGTTDLYEVSATVFFNSKFAVGGVKALALGSLGGGSNPNYPNISSSYLTSFVNSSESLTGIFEQVYLDSIAQPLTYKPHEELVFSFELFENQGINNVEHVGLYLNNKGQDLRTKDYDTSIVYDKYASEELTLVDPNGLIESYEFNIEEIDGFNFEVSFSLTFAQSFDSTNFYVTVWDSDKNADYETYENILHITTENLPRTFVYEKEITFESVEQTFDDVEQVLDDVEKTLEDVDPDAFAEIPDPLGSDESKFDMVSEKEKESVVPSKSVCVDGVLENGVCVIDIKNQESSKSNNNTISIIVVIFILEIILGVVIGIIYSKQRKKSLNFTNSPLGFSNKG